MTCNVFGGTLNPTLLYSTLFIFLLLSCPLFCMFNANLLNLLFSSYVLEIQVVFSELR